jgi:hypothetical protein
MPVETSTKPERTIQELDAEYWRIKARIDAETPGGLAWYDDHEMRGILFEIFNHYRHHWRPTRPGGKIMQSLCTGFQHRGPRSDDTHKPMCPGCAKKMRGDFS